MAREKPRYLFSQKLSNFQIERILRAYAKGQEAAEFLAQQRSARAPNTVYKVYELVRKRLWEVGYYPDPERYFAFWNDKAEGKPDFAFSEAWYRIRMQNYRFRGASDRTSTYLMAEIIFRAERPDFPAAALFTDIKRLVRLTGPLNRPPDNVEIARDAVLVSTLQRGLKTARQINAIVPTPSPNLATHTERLIASLQRKIRARRAAKQAK